MSEPAQNPVSVLLVEDNPGDARLVRDTLRDAGSDRFDLTHVERLSDALGWLSREGADVVLLDLNLPDSWGVDTFLTAQAGAPDVPIVVLTSSDVEKLAFEAMRCGAQDYLIKGQTDGRLMARSLRYAIERKRAEVARDKLIADLKAALAKIKTLSGLLPMCAGCKKIRDDRGYWSQIEAYVQDHSEAEFSHGLCPACVQSLYPGTQAAATVEPS